jgi:nucleoid-associated protein YgaU
MPTRYNKARTIINSSDYYAPLRKSRDLKQIVHYTTLKVKNPSVAERASVKTTRHIWKYGDRLYNLSNKFYGDPRYWWVISWWSGYGVEADIKTGAVILIPIDIEDALRVLGV